MRDERVQNLARTMVRYSIAVRPEQSVGVQGPAAAEPLILAVYEELLKVGAFPALHMTPDEMSEVLYTHGQLPHFETLPRHVLEQARSLDANMLIQASTNTRALSAVDPSKQSALMRTMKPVKEIRLQKPWVLTLFPTPAYAQDAEMSVAAFEEFVYGAMFADQPDPIREWERLSELGIGTNMRLQRFIKNILFDEKIGGTMHLALGESYPETGGTNRSILHWDMIKDLRRGGALSVDGKVIQKDGRFVSG